MCKKSEVGLQLRFSLLAVLFVLAFASCSNIQQMKRAEEEEQTLRELTADMAKKVPWTGALEGDRLTSEIGTKEGIGRGVSLSPLSVIAGGDESDILPVYPFLKDFGSLDTTLLSEEIEQTLDGFCNALRHAENADTYMAKDCLYQLALLIRDLNLVIPEVTEETKAESSKAEPAKADSSKTEPAKPKNEKSVAGSGDGTDNDDDSEEAEEKPEVPAVTFYDSFFYGQPYATGTMYEVPVRFSGKERSADILVFLVKEGSSWKVDELQILRSEQKNGGQ